jgi:site-specific DNA recombinase
VPRLPAVRHLDAQTYRIADATYSPSAGSTAHIAAEKVIVSPNDLEVRFRPNGIEVLALELQPAPAAEDVEEAVA